MVGGGPVGVTSPGDWALAKLPEAQAASRTVSRRRDGKAFLTVVQYPLDVWFDSP
jgi:hypothetical protein